MDVIIPGLLIPNLPDELEATSFDENGQIMSFRHKDYDVKGVQYPSRISINSKWKKD